MRDILLNQGYPSGIQRLLKMFDLIIRNAEILVCDAHVDFMVICPPGMKVANVIWQLDKLLSSSKGNR